MSLLWKIFLIIEAIVIIYIIADVIGWHLWKRKCDKELTENIKKINKKYKEKLNNLKEE